MGKKSKREKRKAVTIHLPNSILAAMKAKAKSVKLKRKVLIEELTLQGWNQQTGFYA